MPSGREPMSCPLWRSGYVGPVRYMSGMPLLTQKQLAEALGLTDRTIRRYVKAGAPTVGTGRAAMFDADAFRAWIARTGRDVKPANGPDPVAVVEEAVRAATELEDQPHGGALLRFVPAAPGEALPVAPQPAPGEERAHSLSARSRSWRTADLAIQQLEGRLRAGKLEASPAHAEALARAARTLSEAVRGDAQLEAELTLREALVASLRDWHAQFGEEGLAELLAEARA